MKKQLLLLVMILLPMVTSADPVEIDGIYYNLIPKGNIAEVTYNPNRYTGEVVIPGSVTYENANYSVTSIGNGAFSGCSSLTSVTIPQKVTSIRDYAFYGCSDLTSVTIPNSVTSIGEWAFANCSDLISITIPNSVTSIGNYAFQECYGLTSVNISDVAAWCNIKFANGANPLFYAHHLYLNGEEIKYLVIPSSVTRIEAKTFEGCSGLTSVTIPNSITSIGNGAFYLCSGLTSVTIPNSVTSIGNGAFYLCSGLTSVTIPNSIKSIGDEVFRYCSGLTSVTIPNNVTSIGDWAFENCSSLTSMTMGSGIKSIRYQAFAYCPELTDVYCHTINVPDTKTDAFKDSYIDYATLHVPAESVNAYKTVAPWKNFKSIVSLESDDTPEPQKCAIPIISYKNGKLTFVCATNGANYQYAISDNDIKSDVGNEVQLTVTYNISVYATKLGYDNSETATATLCWIDKEPTTEGITDGVTQIPSKAVLIQSEGGILKVEGIDDGTQVAVYTPDGKQAGSAVSRNGAALVGTSIQPGNTAIVKIGERAVKLLIK